jgi:mono/diheme cytochrome c family protein
VRPVLAANCYDCHADEKMGGLRLDSREGLLKGGKSGPALVPGDPDKSLIIEAVRQTRPTLKMPKGGRLKPSEIDALTEWVKAGAIWPAPRPPPRPPRWPRQTRRSLRRASRLRQHRAPPRT